MQKMLNKCTVIPSAYRIETDMLFKMQEDLLLKPHKEAVGQAATRANSNSQRPLYTSLKAASSSCIAIRLY